MKKMILVLAVLAIGFLPGIFLHGYLNLTKVGEWGKGTYYDVHVSGNYAYCAAGTSGLDIIDISEPSAPQRVGSYDTPGYAVGVYVRGNYVYVIDSGECLQVIEVSAPSAPVRVGNLKFTGGARFVTVKDNFAYVTSGKIMYIIDVSAPSTPYIVGRYQSEYSMTDIFVRGNYVYTVQDFYNQVTDHQWSWLTAVDVSNPTAPREAGSFFYGEMHEGRGIHISGNYAYVLDNNLWEVRNSLRVIDISNPADMECVGETGILTILQDIYIQDDYAYVTGNDRLLVFDISTPAHPAKISEENIPGSGSDIYYPRGIHVSGNYAYIATQREGLHIVDVSVPSSPAAVGNYGASLGTKLQRVVVRGNYAYVEDYWNGLQVVDISVPSSPRLAGSYQYNTVDNSGELVDDLSVSGNYAYRTIISNQRLLEIIDISNPSLPFAVGYPPDAFNSSETFVIGDFAYVACYDKGLKILDISEPSQSTLVGQYIEDSIRTHEVFVTGNYAYMARGYKNNLMIVDISSPSSPFLKGRCKLERGAGDMAVSGNYAYVVSGHTMEVVNVSDPAAPFVSKSFTIPDSASSLVVDGHYAFVAGTSYPGDLFVIDISDPTTPALAAQYTVSYIESVRDVYVENDYIYLAASRLLILKMSTSSTPPRIHASPGNLRFFSDNTGAYAFPQSFYISNKGGGDLVWEISIDQDWLKCSPTSGRNNERVFVSVDPTELSPGTYSGTITAADPLALDSPQTVAVSLTVYAQGQTPAPFGEFATPTDGAVVSGSIPVTGWALDDFGVQGVQIYREENGGLVFIGDAVFVAGARPDVEQAYPGYPNNYKAGWGYMMLTNFLPGGGNGPFKIHAIATDLEGNQVTLGTKTIICDNVNAVKPFGTIDTPTQGGPASGSAFINFGWVLTPLPNTIPTDGSTIRVWVDGVSLGNPVYNQYRQDIADLFPGYNNSNGAVGYFYLDTTQYENGVHTIQWTAADDGGNTDGIGSRYFTIRNTGESRAAGFNVQRSRFNVDLSQIPVDHSGLVRIRKGYDNTEPDDEISADEKGVINVEIKELERFEIHFFEPGHKNSTLKVNQLPIGSTLDAERGVFSWSPGPGFIGEYRFVFISGNQQGHKTRKDVRVIIRSKF